MTPPMVEVPCWRLFVRGRLRSTFDRPDAAWAAAAALRRDGVRVRVDQSTRRAPGMLEPAAPSAARRHREAAADRMVVLRQATSYYKSPGSVVTALPKESLP